MKRIVCIFLLTIALAMPCFGQFSDSLKISYAERDTIYKRLNDCKELPALRTLLMRQTAVVEAQNGLLSHNSILIDTLHAQIADYMRLDQAQEAEKAALSGMIKQQKKTIRRVKLMTGVIVAPVSFVFGGIFALIIAK